MTHYAGLDVSVKETAICVIDSTGAILWQGKVATQVEAIAEALIAEKSCRHSAMIHSTNIKNMSKAARKMNTTIFVKNAPSYSGLGFEGEGFATLTIATPTGEGPTSARTASQSGR